ncbi:MAG: hypothetical protein IJU70_08505 [Lentisphaeria bacterium]|nr:hypothetical protein [Lentisphaeria bacterium]
MNVTWFDDLTGTLCAPETPGAFILREESFPFDGAVRRRVTLTLKPGEKPRSLRIYHGIGHLRGSGVRCWNTSFKMVEHPLEKMLSEEFRKVFHEQRIRGNQSRTWEGRNFYRWGGIKHAAEFIPGRNSGWYVATEPENPDGILWFSYQEDEFVIADSYRYIDHGSPVISELLFMENCSDWRPPLGWYHDHFQEYFQPVNRQVLELAGNFCITNPLSSDRTLDDAAANGVCITELHNHYPAYGNFVPRAEKWKSVVLHDYPEENFPEDDISPRKINEFIAKLHARNIKVLSYFQVTGDCFRPFAEKNFPEDIAVETDGTRIPAWRECWMMNAMPGSRYAKHIDAMLEELFVRHPDIDGIFVDQVCYCVEDTAHDDGKTGYANRRIANVRESYYPAIEKAARMLHARGKILWLNGSFDTKVQRYADGIMAEGLSGNSEILRYFCLDKPLLVHQYPDEPKLAAGMFSYALRSGAQLISTGGSSRKTDALLSKEAAAVYKEGHRLLEALRGRSWCYFSRPLELPEGVTGNIFHGREPGTFVITVVTPENLPPDARRETLRLRVNLPGTYSVVCRTCGQPDAPGDLRGGTLVFEHNGLSVIILKKQGKEYPGKQITKCNRKRIENDNRSFN